MFNKLLQRQLQKQFGTTDLIPEELLPVFKVINDSYDHFEKDRKMLERSIDLSSNEMIELNRNLRNEKDELKETQKKHKRLFEEINEVLYSVDMVSFKLLQMSAACEKVYGYPTEDFFADIRHWEKIIHPEDKHISKKLKAELYLGKQVLSQYRIILKDQSIRWLENKVIPTLDETGRLIRVDGISIDITERKRTEKELEESVSILEATIESTADGILVVDFNGKIVRFNNKFLELWKIPLEVIESRDDEKAISFVLDQLINPEEFVSKVKELYVKNKDVSFDLLYFKDGRTFERYSQPKLINGKCVGRVWSFRDVTEKKNTEVVLRESGKHLRQIIDLVPHFIFAKNAKGKFILANEAVANVYGCSVDSLLGKGDSDFNSNYDEVEHFLKEDQKVINSGKAKHNIIEHITDSKGNIRILSTTKIPYNYPGVTIPGILGVSVDITERIKTENILKENESQLSIATHIGKLGYWEYDVLNRQFKFNDQFYSIFKTTVEDVGSYSMSDEQYARQFIHPDDISLVTEAAKEAILSPDPGFNTQIYYRVIYANGETGYITTRYFITKDEMGRTVKTYGAIQDITDIKKTDTALKESTGQLRIAAQIAKLGYWEFDVIKGQFTFNDQFYSIFKTNAEEAGGYTMSAESYSNRFVHPDDISVVGKEIADAINSPDPDYSRHIEHRMIYANGETGYMAVRSFITKDEQGNTIKTFGVNQDITDRKRDEATLLKSEVSLEQKNKELEMKNKELEQFAYVASHDLQEPLRTTTSFAVLLQEQYKGKLDEKADKYLTFITQSSGRMKVLINDLLDYSRIGRVKELVQVDCNKLLNEVIADLDTAILETNAEIKATKLPVINGYATEIKQLFQNLITNAIKFRKQNSTPVIIISALKKRNSWEFVVDDNGIGMEEKHEDRIFVIFQRLHTRNHYEGSGIGLAHCKKIVEMHGGNIWVKSEPEKGSSFHFTIPEIIE